MTKKATKRALLSSALALVVCISMLIGTTYAWFTDSVTSTNNIIKSGNLDVELYYQVEGQTDWTKVDENTNIFKENALWEPGHTEVVKLKVVNEGTLALKYNLGVNIASEVGSVNVAGEDFKLSDYIKYAVIDGEQNFTRDTAVAAAEAKNATALKSAYNSNSFLLAAAQNGQESADIFTMVVYMPTTVGNEANYGKDQVVPEIKLGINLFATQYTFEEDSFDEFYDMAAAWTGAVDYSWYDADATKLYIGSAEQLAGLAAIVNGTAEVSTYDLRNTTVIHDDFKNQTIYLTADIDLNGLAWTPIGRIGTGSTDFTYAFKGTFDGQNHTVSNLDVNAHGWAGVFGIAHSAEINNLKVDGVSIVANRMAGAVVGQLYGSIYNCHVANAQIMVTPNAVGDTYDNGDKVGGIVGWLGDNGNNRTLTNCSANNTEIGAYRDVGGIAGYVASSTTVSGNKVDALITTVDQITYFYGSKDPNAGAIYGRTGGTITDENNIVGEEVEVTTTFAKDGLTYKQDGITKEQTLYLVPADYEGTTVNVAAGTANIGGYAFAYNSNIEKIVLPSSVTTLNDRAFRDTSASTVVLNEGLTNISYQAFRNASNVTSVVIPSTVTTISKEAFQNSGITTLNIPANVTTLEYGACRDMKELTNVTITGNVVIPVYAFRACTNLKTVTLLGDNVTFGGKGMIFTNKENGDGSEITVYVANETVKERLLAADTAAKDYGGYNISFATEVSTGADLVDAIASGKKVELTQDINLGKIDLTDAITNDVVIDANGHKITTADAYGIEVTAGKNVTISNADVVMTKAGDYITYAAGLKIANGDYEGATITLKDCTITMANTDWAYAVNMPASVKNLNLVLDNCTLEGAIAVQCWGDNNNITITDSKLICNYTTSAMYTSYCVALQGDGTYNSENNTLVIDNCEFLYSGIDNFNSEIKAAADISGSNTVTVTNCTYGEKVVAD